MLRGLFGAQSPYRKAALAAAIIWTVLIFVLCLWPGRELPRTDIPFVDKWTHFVLFGGFAFLWLCAYPAGGIGGLLRMIVTAAALGWLVECLQGWLPQLGRTKDVADAAADAIGGLLGTLVFGIGMRLSKTDSRL